MVFHLLRKLAPEHAGLPIGLVAFEAAAALPPLPPDVLVMDLRRLISNPVEPEPGDGER